jgi:thioredoxin 1
MDIQNQNEFQETIANNTAVAIDFYADWCGPCQTLLPTVHKLAKEYDGQVTIKKINVDKNRELAAKFGVRSIPTLVYLHKGKEVNRHSGLISEGMLKGHLNQLKNL